MSLHRCHGPVASIHLSMPGFGPSFGPGSGPGFGSILVLGGYRGCVAQK
ncbi:MAG: hypothetical protein WBM14_01455 [Terracidiphilus sp.]